MNPGRPRSTLFPVSVMVGVGEIALCAAAVCVAALLYGDFFATIGYLLPVCTAALVGALLAAVAAVRRWGPGLTMLVSMVGLLVLTDLEITFFAGHEVPALGTVPELGRDLVDGWARMLTVNLPADIGPDLLVTPMLLSWGAAFAAVCLALRTGSVLAPAAPCLLVFIAELMLAASGPGAHLRVTALFLLVMFGLFVLRTIRARTRGGSAAMVAHQAADPWTLTRVLLGVPLMSGVLLLGVAGVQVLLPFMPHADRFDPRAVYAPRLDIVDTISPLATLKRQLREEPPRQLFTVEVGGSNTEHPVDRVRLTVLDRFDGVVWSSSDRYLVAGHTLQRHGELRAGEYKVTERVVLDGLTGPYLPVVGSPTRLSAPLLGGKPVGFDSRSGVMATDDQTLRGATYEVTSVIKPSDAGLLHATPSSDPQYERYTLLPSGLPAELRALSAELARKSTTPYGRLDAINRYLRALPYNLDAPPGHSYGALARVLTGTAPHDSEAYAEQHAAAFAVLARAQGFPTRVVIGYRLRGPLGGLHQVTTQDVHAWPEVYFDRYGWVGFEPTDTSRRPSQAPRTPDSVPVAASPPPSSPSPLPVPSDARPTPKGSTLSPEGTGRSSGGLIGLGNGGLIALIVLGCLLILAYALVISAKAFRRYHRRRAGSGAVRVVGAWREATDRLSERGLPSLPSRTMKEVAERAEGTLGLAARSVTALAPLATSALFAGDNPDERTVRRAWALERQLRRDLYPSRLAPRRLRIWLDPRPLFAGRRAVRRDKRTMKRPDHGVM